jgi:N12 class adenine-specific DNA methylase
MPPLTPENIKRNFADSALIYERGLGIYQNGAFVLKESNPEEGVRFGLFKRAALLGDEMGLGKTLQAIALAISKKEVFGFEKVLVVTPASLKEQWKREIERFSDERAARCGVRPFTVETAATLK